MKTVVLTCNVCGVKSIKRILGRGGPGRHRGHTLSEETRQKISEAMTGRKLSKGTKRKISRGVIISKCAQRRANEKKYKRRNKRITRLILEGYTFTEVSTTYKMYPAKVRKIAMSTIRKVNIKNLSHAHDCIMYYRVNKKIILKALDKY